MTSIQNWKDFFSEWPAELPSGGVLVSSLNEVIPFRRFWLKKDLLLLERMAPDATGGRFLLLSFDVINSVKFTIPLTEATIAKAGFVACDAENRLQTV